MDPLFARRGMGPILEEVGADKILARDRGPVTPRVQQLIDHVVEHGYVVIPDAFSGQQVDEATAELNRLSGTREAGPAVAGGRNSFEGFKTHRIYALLDKCRVFDQFAIHPDVLALNEYFLDPGFLLNAYHSVSIQPGETPQTLHVDNGYVPIPRPHRPCGTAIMIALDAYTEENGATVVVPKSHRWGADPPKREDAIPIIMAKGSVAFFLGTLWHGGGRNTSAQERRALTVQYCQPWMRPLENQFLAVGWDKLDQMPPRLVDMLGYKVGVPFIGYVDGVDPRKAVRRLLNRRNGATTTTPDQLSKI